jgi:phage tail-like protein
MKKLMEKLLQDVYADSGQKFADAQRHDPYMAFNFKVTITGKKTFAKAGFQKVTGLKVKTDVAEYRDGADKQLTPHKIAGLTKYDPITLERGMSEDVDMFDWIAMQINGNASDFKCSVVIELNDRDGKRAKRWDLIEAWISDYETGDFDSEANNVSLDRMVIQHEGFKFNGKTVQ